MRFLTAFFISAVLAVISALAVIVHIMPPGEGGFGIAKMIPIIFVVLVPVCFCLIWFPANLALWLSFRRKENSAKAGGKPLLWFSGLLFVGTSLLASHFLWPLWFHRVHFYYKFEDQFGQPVPRVTVRRYTTFDPAYGQTQAETDEQGLIDESCKPDENFSLVPRKPGYALASENRNGSYSEELRLKQKQTPGLHDVTTIKMWKLQGAEPLVGFRASLKFHYTGTPVLIDLLETKLVESGGDLRITVNRPPGEISERHPQDWGVRIEAVEGGIIAEPEDAWRITYAAPDDGYQQTDVRTAAGNHNGVSGIQQVYFVQSRSGRMYSKTRLSVGISEKSGDPMSVEYTGVANTNRSRNWEGDANTYAALR